MNLVHPSGVVIAVAALSVTSMFAFAAPLAAQPRLPSQRERCSVSDDRLDELSGLASDDSAWYAVGDGGSELRVFVLDPGDCSIRDIRTASTDPDDIEDLALGPDGSVWLADIGDNRRQRDTIALHVMLEQGGSTLHRLAYPDGPHDAEAILLDGAGVPHIVTKEPFGPAGIYRPAGPLSSGETVPLEKVGSLALRATNTQGGPMSGTVGSMLVTGGSVSQDGTMIAVRTYTEAYLFSAPDGDLVAALERPPLRISLPGEPQGEAIAWEPNGTLLSGSEGLSPIRAVPHAAGFARAAGAAPPSEHFGTDNGVSDDEGPSSRDIPPRKERETSSGSLLIAACLAAAFVYLISRRHRAK